MCRPSTDRTQNLITSYLTLSHYLKCSQLILAARYPSTLIIGLGVYYRQRREDNSVYFHPAIPDSVFPATE